MRPQEPSLEVAGLRFDCSSFFEFKLVFAIHDDKICLSNKYRPLYHFPATEEIVKENESVLGVVFRHIKILYCYNL